MFRTSRRIGLAAALLAALPAATLAQAAPERSVMVVSANAEVTVTPDRAHVTFGVESRGKTAAEASGANARTQSAVLAAVRRAGIGSSDIRTSSVSVSPEYQYPREGGRPTLVGYVSRNSVEVDVRDLSLVGAAIDAGLGAGATNIAGPRLAVADPSVAHREALQSAVSKARADAEAVAAAAGVRIVEIVELLAHEGGPSPMPEVSGVQFRAQAVSDVPTPVEAGLIRVRASVTIRFAIAPRQ